MFEDRTKLAYIGLILVILGVPTVIGSYFPFHIALSEYPTAKPTRPTAPTVPLVLQTSASSVETFWIGPPNTPECCAPPPNTYIFGERFLFDLRNTIEYYCHAQHLADIVLH